MENEKIGIKIGQFLLKMTIIWPANMDVFFSVPLKKSKNCPKLIPSKHTKM